MRVLKIDIESDLIIPGCGRPDVRNEISVIEADEGYELESVYSIDASDHRARNTNEFYSDIIDLGSKEEIDEEYFKPSSSVQLSTNSLEQRDIMVEYFPSMEKSRQTTYDLDNPNSTPMSPFSRDLVNLDEERIFADAIYESIDDLPIHEENQDPVSAKEFERWIDQIPRKSYFSLVERIDEANQIFEENVADRSRDFEDSLKSTFSQVSKELSETYSEPPSPHELYELFTDIRGLKPVSSQNISNHGYATSFGQNMETFVIENRKETALQPGDIERMRPNEDIQNPNGYKLDSGAARENGRSSNNFLESKNIRLVEGVFTIDDDGSLEDFLRWNIDE